MKVKDLIKYLADFNPNANVSVIINDMPATIFFGGWDCNGKDSECTCSDIDKEKLNVTDIYLELGYCSETAKS